MVKIVLAIMMTQYGGLAVGALEEDYNTATGLYTEDLIIIQDTTGYHHPTAVTYLIRFTQLAVNVTLNKMSCNIVKLSVQLTNK